MLSGGEILDKVISKLLEDFDALDSISESAKDETASNRRLEILATIANSRARLAKSIAQCLQVKGDPRFKQFTNVANKDFASIVRNMIALDKQALMTFKSGLPKKERFRVTTEE